MSCVCICCQYCSSDLPPFDISDCFVVSDSYNFETTLSLLESALDAQAPVIIIEQTQLGDETSRWIRVGNCLHKTAVLSAVGCVAVGAIIPLASSSVGITASCIGLGLGSVVCAALYALSWQFDPCCKYQPTDDTKILRRLPFVVLSSTAPVVLVRHDDTRRKWLQNLLATAATLMCIWRLYHSRK